ncbi:MAG: mobile mystery protein A [Flavobacteriaceae bacterium]|nr:mobile mystery protein A [Flavobacteriaceae bacterium]MCY4215742.1 mobile mystery protein A [Flavobacteriaceae bacterium]MCY4268037.1 mobile mystery protein A [Flavobacteriaceae bacterium]MCY4298725.1 mobile mystery protein A [Flavobacteriaceae bacterium]
MRNKKHLLIKQLDLSLVPFHGLEKVLVPEKGWISTIRSGLNMTMEQLGKKLKLSRGAIQKIEQREATGQITLKKMKKIGDSLNLHFIYGFAPKNGTLEKFVEIKANELAKKIVSRTNQTMKLENQEINQNKLTQSIVELANELKLEMRKSLWH